MKVIIAGSRDITDERLVIAALQEAKIECGIICTEVVCGMARGVDTIGLELAKKFKVPWKEFPADWNQYGKRAGALRNIQMGDYADALVAVRLNNSRGTTHMIEYLQKLGKPVYVKDVQ